MILGACGNQSAVNSQNIGDYTATKAEPDKKEEGVTPLEDSDHAGRIRQTR